MRIASAMKYGMVPGLNLSAISRNAGFPENCATAPGMTTTDCANTIGITPDELMRSGMKLRDASRIRPRAIVRCGIWIRTRRAAIVTVTTDATTEIGRAHV